jgi:hypothetical protein
MYISSQSAIWKSWSPAAHMVATCGQPFIDASKAMDKRGQVLTVGAFIKTAGMPTHDRVRLAGYMHSSDMTVPGIHTLCVKIGDALPAGTKQAFLEWHLLHPQNDLIHSSRSMLFPSLFFSYACHCATTVSSVVPYLYIPHCLQRQLPKLRGWSTWYTPAMSR